MSPFFWVPIPVNQYEQFSLDIAVRSPLGDLYSYKSPQPKACTRNPFQQLLTKEEDLPFWERIHLPVLKESSPSKDTKLKLLLYMSLVFGHFDIHKMADNNGTTLPHETDFDTSTDGFCWTDIFIRWFEDYQLPNIAYGSNSFFSSLSTIIVISLTIIVISLSYNLESMIPFDCTIF